MMGYKEKNMYIDPGSGSVILQVVLAALLGVGVTIKLFWGKIKSLFSQKKEEDQAKN